MCVAVFCMHFVDVKILATPQKNGVNDHYFSRLPISLSYGFWGYYTLYPYVVYTDH